MARETAWAFAGLLLSCLLMTVGCTNETRAVSETAKPENIVISVDKEGNFYWNGELVTGGQEEIFARLTAQQGPPPPPLAVPPPQAGEER
jgi:hypothetical protein